MSSNLEQHKLELPALDGKIEEIESVVSEDNKPEQNSESRCKNLENEDDSCGHIIDEEKQYEHANKRQNDEIEMDCLPNGDNELEPHFHLNDDNELESGCFDNEDNGIFTEDMDGQ